MSEVPLVLSKCVSKVSPVFFILFVYLERISVQPMRLPNYSGFTAFVYLHTIIGVTRMHRLA